MGNLTKVITSEGKRPSLLTDLFAVKSFHGFLLPTPKVTSAAQQRTSALKERSQTGSLPINQLLHALLVSL